MYDPGECLKGTRATGLVGRRPWHGTTTTMTTKTIEVMTTTGSVYVEGTEFRTDSEGDLYVYKDGEEDPVAMFNRDAYIGIVRDYGSNHGDKLPEVK